MQARVKEKAAVATPAAEAAARMAQANPNPDDSAGEWAPVKKWLKKLRAEVAALLGETPVPPPPPPSVPTPPKALLASGLPLNSDTVCVWSLLQMRRAYI